MENGSHSANGKRDVAQIARGGDSWTQPQSPSANWRQRDAALPGRAPRDRDEARSRQREPRRAGHHSSRPRLTQTLEWAARAFRQPIPTAGATIRAWFAHSQVSPIRLTVLEPRRTLSREIAGVRLGAVLWQQVKRLAVAWCDGCEVAAVEGQDYWGIESLGQSDD
jgi:hypothetical protein